MNSSSSLIPTTLTSVSSSSSSSSTMTMTMTMPPSPNERSININNMEQTLPHTSGRKMMKPKHSMSFNERSTRRTKHSKDVTRLIKEKFKESKGCVNEDLVKYSGDLGDLVEKTKECKREWRESIEKLIRIADECRMMSVDEFWVKCTKIVEELDNRRRELEMGTLKRAHTTLLFILTRCTRLVQFLKDDHHDDHNQQFWFLNAQNFRPI